MIFIRINSISFEEIDLIFKFKGFILWIYIGDFFKSKDLKIISDMTWNHKIQLEF